MLGAPVARVTGYGCIQAEHGDLFHSRKRMSDEVRQSAAGAVGSTVTLFRPVGQAEVDLIAASGFRAFPPRRPHQPIFCPVLNEAYALQIARDRNTKDAASGSVRDVTRFRVRAAFLRSYPVTTPAGDRTRSTGSSRRTSPPSMRRSSARSKCQRLPPTVDDARRTNRWCR